VLKHTEHAIAKGRYFVRHRSMVAERRERGLSRARTSERGKTAGKCPNQNATGKSS
jgi:hypothetical protein